MRRRQLYLDEGSGCCERATTAGQLSVQHADPALDERARALIERHDTRAMSFADAAGAVTGQDAGSAAVFGLDEDFTVLDFAIEPPATR